MRIEAARPAMPVTPIQPVSRPLGPQETATLTPPGTKAPVPESAPEPPGYDRKQVEEAADWLNKAANALRSELRFKVHQATKQIIVSVVDANGNVIREIPPEKALDAYAEMAELFGFFVDEKA